MYLKSIIPKLPMRDKTSSLNYYQNLLGFQLFAAHNDYLIFTKDAVELHLFEYRHLNPLENDGQVYIRVNQIEIVYQNFIDKKVEIHPNGFLENKPWGQKEFSLLDPDHNCLTFGEAIAF